MKNLVVTTPYIRTTRQWFTTQPLVKFCIIGAASWVIGETVLTLLVEGCHLEKGAAYWLQLSCALSFNFAANYRWTWWHRQTEGTILRKVFKFLGSRSFTIGAGCLVFEWLLPLVSTSSHLYAWLPFADTDYQFSLMLVSVAFILPDYVFSDLIVFGLLKNAPKRWRSYLVGQRTVRKLPSQTTGHVSQ